MTFRESIVYVGVSAAFFALCLLALIELTSCQHVHVGPRGVSAWSLGVKLDVEQLRSAVAVYGTSGDTFQAPWECRVGLKETGVDEVQALSAVATAVTSVVIEAIKSEIPGIGGIPINPVVKVVPKL
jgi:hypothetical protein